jgi:FKBP-type peptidyl-prolyl cis-trans isomerase
LKRFFSTLALCFLAACGGGDSTPATPDIPGPTTLVTEDISVGTGALAVNGDTVTVHYIGMFLDGRQFDNSYTSNRPLTFQLGAHAVIAGFEQGIVGMRVGGKRRLTIPSSLAYGTQGRGPIPPNTPLRFEVELLGIAGK